MNGPNDREGDGQPFGEWAREPQAEAHGRPEEEDPRDYYPDAADVEAERGRDGADREEEVDPEDYSPESAAPPEEAHSNPLDVVAEEVDPDDFYEV